MLPAPNNRDHDLDPMNGVIVIVAYRPKPGKEKETLELVRSRVPTLRKEGLVTDRAPTIMRARDGTIIEVSEWKSNEAISTPRRRIQSSSRCGTSSLKLATVFRSTRYLSLPRCLPVSNQSLINY